MGGKNSGITQEMDRIHRINTIWEIKTQNPKWSRERLVAEFQYRYGCSRRTVLDYLKVLENSKRIEWKK